MVNTGSRAEQLINGVTRIVMSRSFQLSIVRVVFLMDKIMRKFGLNGRSVVPLMSGVACVKEGHASSDDQTREWMSGNLCRCGAYPNIVAAVREVAGKS